jgi:acetyl esterase/lipase
VLERAALGLAVLAVVPAALIVVPAPWYLVWVGRFVSLETSLLPAAFASTAILLGVSAARRSEDAAGSWLALLLAIPALIVTIAPPLAILPLLREHGATFSLAEYVRGVRTPPTTFERDVALDPHSPELAADLYRAGGPGPHPLVVVVHGGSWRSGDKGQATHVSRALAASGYVVADVRYRLAPEHRFPAAVQDVKCLIGRLLDRAGEFDVDPERVALLGRSAGGEIALVAAYSAGDPRLAPSCTVRDYPVAAVIALYAPTDLVWGHAHPIRPDVVRGPESIELYLGGKPEEAPDAYRLASAQSWIDRPLPRTLLVHGRDDRLVFVEHARRLARGLAAAGQPAVLVEIPFAEHAFDVRPGGFGEQLTRGILLKFLSRSFAHPPFQ